MARNALVPGDTVQVTRALNSIWFGQGVVVEDRHGVSGHTYVQMTTGGCKGMRGHFPTSELLLVSRVVPEDPNIAALTKAVDTLRAAGYTVNVDYTAPTTKVVL